MRNKKDLMHQLEMVGGSTMRVLIQSDTGEGSPQVSIGDIVMESCKPYIDSEGFSRNAHVVIKATGIIENVVKCDKSDMRKVSYVQSKHLDPSNPVYANSYDRGHLEFDLIQVYSDREFMTQDSDKMPFGHELSIYFTDGSCEVYATCPDLDELEAKIYELVDKFKW